MTDHSNILLYLSSTLQSKDTCAYGFLVIIKSLVLHPPQSLFPASTWLPSEYNCYYYLLWDSSWNLVKFDTNYIILHLINIFTVAIQLCCWSDQVSGMSLCFDSYMGNNLDISANDCISNSKLTCLLLAFTFSTVFFSFSYFTWRCQPEISICHESVLMSWSWRNQRVNAGLTLVTVSIVIVRDDVGVDPSRWPQRSQPCMSMEKLSLPCCEVLAAC